MTTLTHEDGFTLAGAQKLAQALANTIKLPTYVVDQNGRHIIQDDADIDVYGGRANIVSTYQPVTDVNWNSTPLARIQDELARMEDEQCAQDFAQPQPDNDDPNLCDTSTGSGISCACGAAAILWVHGKNIHDDVCQDCFTRHYENNFEDSRSWVVDPIAVAPPGFPEDDDDSPDGGGPPRAVTLTSILIDQVAQRNRLCPNCQGAHFGWQCPAIARVLFAPPATNWTDVDLGKELCQLRWRDFPRFATLLRTVGAAGHLRSYAASYVAYIESYGPASLTIPQVLTVWGRILDDQQGAA